MIASAQTLRLLKPIYPFEERTKVFGMTYGLGPCGYDIRVAEKVFLLPQGFENISSMERFNMPDDLLGIVHDKSTWARRGLAVQNTVIEPGWRGYLTIEVSNHGNRLLVLEPGMPIAQVIFHLLDHVTDQPYDGKYQDQLSGPQKAILEDC